MTFAVLWDLDGTLVDSEEFHWQSWRETLATEGIEITYDQFLASFGLKNDPIMRNWLGDGYSAERARRLGDTKEAEYRRLAEVHGLTALPGARQWIETLRAAGWKQAIATSAPRENADVMLRATGIAALFDAVVAAEDVTAGKPDPQVFLTAAARVGVAPSHCVVVEDAVAGVEGARRAGMKCIGVNARAPLPADLVVGSLTDLAPDAFDRLVRRI